MKSMSKKRRFGGLCAAALTACVLSASWAGDSAAEQGTSTHAPARAPDVTKGDTEKPLQADAPNDAPKPCPGADDSLLRKILCWWQDGLSRQSRALIP